jgi:DNA-binding transcriptional LysR family regulator
MLLGLRELEVFRAVMEEGSITGAAGALRVSQPAVSKMLQQAEARLGFALFLRQGRRLRPSAEAQALFPGTLNAFAALDLVQRLAGDLRAGGSGLLSVAAIPSLANSIMPRAIEGFRAERPEVSVVLHVVQAPEALRMMEDARVDFAATIGPVGGAEVQVGETCETELGCLLPATHPLAARQALRPEDLAPWPLISPGGQWPLGALLSVAFADADVPLRIAVEVPQATVAGGLVRAGAGIAVLDGFGLASARGEDPTGTLAVRPFRPRMVSVARLLRPRHRQVSRLADAFRRTLLEVAAAQGCAFAPTRRGSA